MNLRIYLLLFVNIIEAIRNQPNCPEIQINHGRAKYKQRGRFVKFFCNNGYMLAGDRYSTCVHGEWDTTIPKCVRNTCRPAKYPINGLIYPSHGGGVLNFFCKPDYILRGPTTIYCDGTKWDNILPTCQKSNTTVQLNCDFESDDLCGWNHDLNHDFDWTRLNYQTPSHLIGTGPSYDHTKGPNNNGYYMYIESTSRNLNDKARLISPIFNKTSSNQQQQCFEFYYHMYGRTTGLLNVYLKKFNDTWDNLTKLWTKDGNQGDQWYRGFINLGIINDDYQIIIEGVRGPGYVSDIAIDDVRIIQNCQNDDDDDDDDQQQFTTELPQTSVDPFMVESCENRCDSFETTTITTQENQQQQQQNHSILLCDCDDGCYERGRCCPDYFDYCLKFQSTTDILTTNNEIITYITEPRITTTLATTTIRTRPLTTIRTSPQTTTRTTTPTTTTIRTSPQTTRTTTTTMKSTPSTETRTIKTTPATTTIRARPLTTIRTSPQTTTRTTTTERIVYVRPDNDKKDLKNDEIDLIPTINDDDDDDDDDNDIPFTPQITHERVVNNNNHQQQQQQHKPIIFAIGVIIGILFTTVIVIFLIKKYELFNCLNRKLRRNGIIRQSSNGNSQSDVRFLTNDEILDLSLPGDYDTL